MTASEDNLATRHPVELGTVLAGRYRLAQQLGEGGMGVVYAADHLELETRVAIKLLQPQLAEDTTARARFLREARLAASIEGDHSTRIHDVGTDEAGRPYMVMEYLAGETASARLAREGPLPVVDAATVLVQLLDTLAEAHAKGLVHRDLKPANLFLVDKPGERVWVKVLDFGISKMMSGSRSDGKSSITLTAPRTMLGSPEYMSPEQLRDSATVDSRSDLWACGVILFELLTGTTPFEGSSLPDLYARIVSQAPKTLAGATETIPAPMARMIERCLRKEASQRPQTAYELAVVLAPHASDSAKALVPRIRAWCKSDAPLPSEPRSRRAMIGGLSLVGVSGVLAFAAASFSSPAPSVHGAASVREVMTLDPVASAAAPTPPPAPSAVPTTAPSVISPAYSSSAASSAARPRPPTSAPAKTATARPRDLDGIDLIQ